MLGSPGMLPVGAPTFSPVGIPGLTLWLAGNRSPTTLNSGKISQWDDISGSGNHAIQATAINQPALTRSDNRENLLSWSESFENAAWAKQANIAATDNQIANPIDGGITAALITTDGADGGRFFQTWTGHQNSQVIVSGYFKDGTAGTGTGAFGYASDYTVVSDSTGSLALADGWTLRWEVFTLSGGGVLLSAACLSVV